MRRKRQKNQVVPSSISAKLLHACEQSLALLLKPATLSLTGAVHVEHGVYPSKHYSQSAEFRRFLRFI